MALQNENAREAYRILYPERERPHLRVLISVQPEAGVPRLTEIPGVAEVLECSESGIRFRPLPKWPSFSVGAVVRGRIQFRLATRARDLRVGAPGRAVPVQGHVIRLDGRVVVLHLDPPGVPFAVILGEQAALLARYPCWGAPGVPSSASARVPGTDGCWIPEEERSRSPARSV